MNSNSKQVKTAIREYIKESITLEGHDQENTVSNLWETFLIEKGNYACKNEREQDIFMSWLQGIPSSFNIAYYDLEVEELLQKWGLNTAGKNRIILSNWFLYLIYREVKTLLKAEKETKTVKRMYNIDVYSLLN